MKILNLLFVTLFLGNYCLAQNVSLRDELRVLEPYLGKNRESQDLHPDGNTVLHHFRTWEPGHNGMIICITKGCTELGTRTDGYMYYNPDKDQIELFTLTSNGNIASGTVSVGDGKLVVRGTLILKDRKLEYKNIYELTSDGTISDKYYRIENGDWKPGHSRVWKKPS